MDISPCPEMAVATDPTPEVIPMDDSPSPYMVVAADPTPEVIHMDVSQPPSPEMVVAAMDDSPNIQ